jgi:Helix-turn-helix domain
MLAGVSTEYYAKVERGNLADVSDSVLNALASALQLDDAERIHLSDLARATASDLDRPATRRARSPRRTEVRPSISRLLESMPRPPTSATPASTSSPPTQPASPSTTGSSRRARCRLTWPDSYSWIPAPSSSSQTGEPSPTTSPPPCESWPALFVGARGGGVRVPVSSRRLRWLVSPAPRSRR